MYENIVRSTSHTMEAHRKPCYFNKQPGGCKYGANCCYYHEEATPCVISALFPPIPSFSSTILPFPPPQTIYPPNFVQYKQGGSLVLPQSLPILAFTQPMSVHAPTEEVEVRILVGDHKIKVNVPRLSSIQVLKEIVAGLPDVMERWPEISESLVSKFVLIDEKNVKAPCPYKVSKLVAANHYTIRLFYLPRGISSCVLQDTQVIDHNMKPICKLINNSPLYVQLHQLYQAGTRKIFFCDTNVPNEKANRLRDSSLYSAPDSRVAFTEVIQIEYGLWQQRMINNDFVASIICDTKVPEARYELLFRGFYEYAMRGMPSKSGPYPVEYNCFRATGGWWWWNAFNDFRVVAQATFIMAQYSAIHSSSSPMEFILVSDDADLRALYDQSQDLKDVLGQLNITQSIRIVSFEECM